MEEEHIHERLDEHGYHVRVSGGHLRTHRFVAFIDALDVADQRLRANNWPDGLCNLDGFMRLAMKLVLAMLPANAS